MTIGQKIKKLRIEKGWNQDELAEKMCIPKKTLSGYECDRVDIKSSVILELAKYLDTSPNYLLGCEENPFISEMTNLMKNIQDKKVQEILLIQVKALVENNKVSSEEILN